MAQSDGAAARLKPLHGTKHDGGQGKARQDGARGEAKASTRDQAWRGGAIDEIYRDLSRFIER